MANITICNTIKVGWVRVNMGDYYPTREDNILDIRASTIGAVTIGDWSGNTGVKVYFINRPIPFYLSNTDMNGFMTVDSINGISPSSSTDLRDKILELL